MVPVALLLVMLLLLMTPLKRRPLPLALGEGDRLIDKFASAKFVRSRSYRHLKNGAMGEQIIEWPYSHWARGVHILFASISENPP